MGLMDVIRRMAPSAGVERQMVERPIEDPEEVTGKLFSEWRKRDEWLRPVSRMWRESLAFSRGDQYLKYMENVYRFTTAPNPNNYPRPVINVYDSIRRTIVAHLTRNRPIPEVLPESSSAADVEAARVCNDLIEILYDKTDMSNVMAEICTWMFHTNNVWVRPRWDTNRGDLIAAEVPAELLPGDEADPMQPPLLREGGIALDILSPFQVYPPKEARSLDDCGDLIVEHLLTPSQVRTMFPEAKNLDPDTPSADGTSFLMVQEENQAYSATKLEYIRCVEQWILPCPTKPRGQHIIASKGELLWDEEYPFAQFPILHAQIEKMPMSFHGRSWAWDLKSPQKSMNSSWGHLIHHMDLVVNQPWVYPVGSVKANDMQKRPGALIPYDGRAGAPPSPMQMAQLPQWVQEFPERCQTMASNLSISEVMQGRIPYSGMSGRTIAFISDLDATRLGTWAKQLATLLAKILVSMLNLYRDNAPEEKTMQLVGKSVSKTMLFRTADLRWGDIRVTESSFLPQPSAVKRELLMQYVQLGIMTPEEFKTASKGSSEVEDAASTKQDQAWAMDNIALVRSGQKPFTKPFMHLPTHIEVTEEYLKSSEYRRLDPQEQQALEDYWNWLVVQMRAMQPPMPPVGPGQEGEEQSSEGTPQQLNGGPKVNPGVDAAEEMGLGMGQGGIPMGVTESMEIGG